MQRRAVYAALGLTFGVPMAAFVLWVAPIALYLAWLWWSLLTAQAERFYVSTRLSHIAGVHVVLSGLPVASEDFEPIELHRVWAMVDVAGLGKTTLTDLGVGSFDGLSPVVVVQVDREFPFVRRCSTKPPASPWQLPDIHFDLRQEGTSGVRPFANVEDALSRGRDIRRVFESWPDCPSYQQRDIDGSVVRVCRGSEWRPSSGPATDASCR